MAGLGSLAKGASRKSSKKNTKKKQGKAYNLRNTTKARVKIGVVGSRAQLAYKELTKAAAQGENTKIIRGIRQMYSDAKTDGEALHDSILGMADRVGVTTEQYNKLASMDPDILAQMYNANDLTFEVFFNYEGINKVNGTYIVSDEKRQDVEWFINEYERIAGPTDINSIIDRFANDVI